MADAAFFVGRDVNAFFDAFGGIFQRNFHANLQIRALIVLLAAASSATAEHLAENIGKVEALRAAEPAKTAESARAAAHALFERGMAVLVVHGAFFFVGQRVVGFLHFFKFIFRFFVARITVGMIFHRQLAVGFFDFVVASTARHAECFVKIFIAHSVIDKIGFCENCPANMGGYRKTQGHRAVLCFRPSENPFSDGLLTYFPAVNNHTDNLL